MTRSKTTKPKTLISKIGTAIFALIFIALVAALLYVTVQAASGNRPSLFGYRFYYVLTDSMEPEIMPGDIILSRTLSSEEDARAALKVGVNATFIAQSGLLKGQRITHRVIREPYFDTDKGAWCIVTQGVKAGATPDAPTPLANVEAVMIRNAGVVSYIYHSFSSAAGLALLVALPMVLFLGLLIYRLITIIKTPADKFPSKPEDAEARKKEIAEQAVRDYIAEQAVREYKASHPPKDKEDKD